MKKRQQIKKNLVTALEVPMDLAYKDAIVTLTCMNQAVIENYRSILRYTREEIVISTLRGRSLFAVSGWKSLAIHLRKCGCPAVFPEYFWNGRRCLWKNS